MDAGRTTFYFFKPGVTEPNLTKVQHNVQKSLLINPLFCHFDYQSVCLFLRIWNHMAELSDFPCVLPCGRGWILLYRHFNML